MNATIPICDCQPHVWPELKAPAPERSGYPIPPGVLAILEQKDRDLKSCVLALKVYAPERLIHHSDDCNCFVCNTCELWQRLERAF